MTDFPSAPVDLVIGNLSARSVILSWSIPPSATAPITGFLSSPVTSYTVQALDRDGGGGRDEGGGGYRDLVSVPDVRTTTAAVTGLHPGSRYSLRVLSHNMAGTTPSQETNITTNSSGN